MRLEDVTAKWGKEVSRHMGFAVPLALFVLLFTKRFSFCLFVFSSVSVSLARGGDPYGLPHN